MPVIVAPEPGYDSLVSVAYSDTYCEAMWHAAWGDVMDATKETALRHATQYLLSAYSIQPENLDPVHPRVQAACCEAAVRALAGPLLSDVAPQYVDSVTVGPITRRMSAPANGGQKRYAVIDALLRGLVAPMGQIKLVRA